MPIISPTAISPHRAGINWSSYCTTLSIVGSGTTSLIITPTITGTGHEGISYEYSTDGINYTEHGTSTGSSYTATGLTADTLYYWRVRPYKGTEYKEYSDVFWGRTNIDYDADTNLWAWWQPRTETNVVKDVSDRISQITDLSGNDRHLLQATDNNKPLWNNGADFDSTARAMLLNTNLANGFTIYLVLNIRTYASSRFIFKESGSDSYAMLFGSIQSIRLANANVALVADYGVIIGDKCVLCCVVKSGENIVTFNGGKDLKTTIVETTSYPDFWFGSIGGTADMIIYEGLIRSGADNEETRIKIINTLKNENDISIEDVDLLVLAGQSNAQGRAAAADISNPVYQAELTRGYIYDRTANVYDQNRYNLIQAGVKCDAGVNPGFFGFETSLMLDLTAYQNKDLFILKYWYGGTSIYQNANPDWNIASTGELYDNLKAYILEAQKALRYFNKRGRIKFFIWMQGEEDALSTAARDAYATNLDDFISAVKTYIDSRNKLLSSRGLSRVVLCKIYPSTKWTYGDAIRTIQDAYCVTNAADTIKIETDTYNLLVDDMHYDADSNVAIGSQIATAIKDL